MKFTEMPHELRVEAIELVNRRWGQLHKLEEDWGERVFKYLLATNAGGAVALLSFLGTGKAPNIVWAKISLALFIFGLICVGIALARIYHRMERLYDRYRADASMFFKGEIARGTLVALDEERSRHDSCWAYILPYVCFLSFILGCTVGAYALFVSQGG